MFYFLLIIITRFTSPLAHTLLNVNPEQNYHKILQKGKIGTYCFSSIIKANSSHISMADWARFDADADSSGDVAEFLTLAPYMSMTFGVVSLAASAASIWCVQCCTACGSAAWESCLKYCSDTCSDHSHISVQG